MKGNQAPHVVAVEATGREQVIELRLHLQVSLPPDLIESIVAAARQGDTTAQASYTLKQFAQRHGRSVSLIYDEVKRGHLRVTRPGGRGRVVSAADEAAWLAAKALATASE